MSPSRATTRYFAQRLALAAGALVLCLVTGELVFRLPPVVRLTGGGTPGRLAWDEHRYDRIRHDNVLGVRSFHLKQPKPVGSFRIVVLGDSFSFGDKIAKTQNTWPYVMEAALKQAGRDVQVINLAKNGFTSVNEEEMLRRHGWRLKPDLVLVQYLLNDPLPSWPDFGHVGSRWLFRTTPLSPIGHEWLDHHSYMYSFLNERNEGRQIQRDYPEGYALLHEDDSPHWQAARSAIQSMGEQAERRGVPMRAVIMPWPVAGLYDVGSYPFVAVHDKVTATFEGAGAPVLDVRQVYASHGKEGRYLWALPNDWHPNEEAHAIIGNSVGQWLIDQGVLKSVE